MAKDERAKTSMSEKAGETGEAAKAWRKLMSKKTAYQYQAKKSQLMALAAESSYRKKKTGVSVAQNSRGQHQRKPWFSAASRTSEGSKAKRPVIEISVQRNA